MRAKKKFAQLWEMEKQTGDKEEKMREYVEQSVTVAKNHRGLTVMRLTGHTNLILSNVSDKELVFVINAMNKGSYRLEVAEQVLTKNWSEIMKNPDFDFPLDKAIYNEEVPSLASVRLYKGVDFVHDFIHFLISDFVTSFAVGNGTTGARLKETAKIIFKNYYYLKLSEVKFLLSEARKSVVTYNSMDGNKVLQIFEEYVSKRTDVVENTSMSNHGTAVWDDKVKRQSVKEKVREGSETTYKPPAEIDKQREEEIKTRKRLKQQTELLKKQYGDDFKPKQ